MKKLKRFLSLMLTSCIFIGMGSELKTKAQTIDEVAKLEIKVKGNGSVIVNDGYSNYVLEDKDVLTANVTVNSDLQLTVTPDDGYSIASVTGVDYKFKDNGNSKVYNVTTKANGTFIDVNFEKETKEENKDEANEEIKDEINNLESEKINSNEDKIHEFLTEEQLKEIELINQYIEGVKMLPNMVEARKEKATELGLLDWVDENYFLIDDFYRGKSEADIENLGANILVNTVTNQELDNWAIDLKYGTLLRSRMLKTVTYYEMVSYGQSTVGKFQVDGKMAFCAQHSKTTPAKGASTGAPSLNTNELVRKVLYYGYGGPGQLSGMTGNYGWVMTSLGLSKAYTGTGGSTATSFIEQVSQLPAPPSSFNVYIVQTNGGSTQDLAYWEYSPKGSLQISKESADTSITNGNNYYSVEGAVYGVYTNSNATGQVVTLTIGSNGWSQEVSLDAGTYYMKEISAPRGFALDNTIYPIAINAGSKTTKLFTDIPQNDPVGVLLRKVDADTGNATAQGSGTLADAHFTIKFYAGEYNDGVNPADLGVSPTRTWVMKTDSDGYTDLSDAYKVSGDDFYRVGGEITLPLGTITIQETKPPIGYKINSEIFVRRIIPNGVAESVNTYNAPIIREDSLNFTIKKVQTGTNIVIANAKFRHTKPDGSDEELQTGDNGEVVIRGLTQGVHKLVETSAPEGYEVNENEFVFEVKGDNTIEVKSNTTNMGMSYSEVDGDGILTVEDEVRPYSLRLTKVNDKGAVLEGAEFTLYSDSNCNNPIESQISDANGNLKFNNLRPGIRYYMKETDAPPGYKIPVDIFGNVHVYEIYVESTPVNNVFNYYIDGTKYTINYTNSKDDIYLAGTKNDREVNLKVVNTIGMKLPKTGSFLMIPLVMVGIGLMSYSIFSSKKKKVNNE